MAADFRWVMRAILLWPRITAVAVIALLCAHLLTMPEGTTLQQTVLMLIADLLFVAWAKTMLVSACYSLLYCSPFPASFTGVSFIATAVAGAFFLAQAWAGQIPGIERDFPRGFLMVPIGYLAASLCFGAFIYVSYKMHRNRRVPWRRLDEDRDTKRA